MNYILRGESFQVLYVEDENNESVFFNKTEQKWIYAGFALMDARVGFDPSEPEESPYRYGNFSLFDELTPISKEQAEKFINQKIDEKELRKLIENRNRS